LNRKEWKHLCSAKVKSYFKLHKLAADPRYTDKDENKTKDQNSDNGTTSTTTKTITTEKKLAMIAAEGKNEDWQTHFGCIKIIVDSKTLYDIVAGEAVYSGTNVRDEFIHIDNILRQWMTTDRTTASPVGNPVEWRPRELNHGADSQCNNTLDNNVKHCFEAKDVSKYIH